MYFFNPIPYVQYRFCTLSEGKEWFVSFYVADPETGKLKRIRIKINRVHPLRERRRVAKMMMASIDQRLALGWNPLIEKTPTKSYAKAFEVFDLFLAAKKKETEPNTIRCYASLVKIFRTWLEKHAFNAQSSVVAITDVVAAAFMDEKSDELSPKTFNNYITFFRNLFDWMINKKYVFSNPFDQIPKKAKRLLKKNRRLLSDDELDRLRAYLHRENKEYLAMAMICYCCFVRPKELALLKCRDINLERQSIHIRAEIAKNDNESYRTIPDDLVPILRRLDYSHPDWFLFGQHPGEGDFTPSKIQVCSRKIAKWWDQHVRPDCDFGMDLKFYSLKDTGITNMLGDGVPINIVQQQADHSSVAMTAIYVGKTGRPNDEIRGAGLLKH